MAFLHHLLTYVHCISAQSDEMRRFADRRSTRPTGHFRWWEEEIGVCHWGMGLGKFITESANVKHQQRNYLSIISSLIVLYLAAANRPRHHVLRWTHVRPGQFHGIAGKCVICIHIVGNIVQILITSFKYITLDQAWNAYIATYVCTGDECSSSRSRPGQDHRVHHPSTQQSGLSAVRYVGFVGFNIAFVFLGNISFFLHLWLLSSLL